MTSREHKVYGLSTAKIDRLINMTSTQIQRAAEYRVPEVQRAIDEGTGKLYSIGVGSLTLLSRTQFNYHGTSDRAILFALGAISRVTLEITNLSPSSISKQSLFSAIQIGPVNHLKPPKRQSIQ